MSHQTSTKKKTTPKSSLERQWQVIVLNDSVSLTDYATLVLQKVLGFNHNKAAKHIREVHEKGSTVVWTGQREPAELYAQILQQWQLNSLIKKDA